MTQAPQEKGKLIVRHLVEIRSEDHKEIFRKYVTISECQNLIDKGYLIYIL